MELFWLWVQVLGSAIIAGSAKSLPVDQDQQPRPEDVELAEGYLKRFYNLKPSRGNTSARRRPRATSALEEKIREMQHFFGLSETGRLDPATLQVMKAPRCGVPDVENYSFYPNRPKWKKNTITYTIAKYTPDMSRAEQDRSFLSALKMWSDATPLKFIRVDRGPADIVLTFARRTHGDFYPFDGPRGVLAHAFQPGQGLGGDVHFDEDETWTNGRQGYSLFAVAAHELGHSLGLSHSRDPSAIMYPNYRSQSSTQSSLSKDDVLGIQSLYGKPASGAGTQPGPNNCDSVSLDAALIIGSDLVFFKNRQMWVRTTRPPYTTRLQSAAAANLPNVGAQVDAAYDIPASGAVYILTGQRYLAVQGLQLNIGSIHEFGIPSRVRQVDAAVHVGENGKTFFFVGDVYYRYDERRRRMDPGFPRLIRADWRGIPQRVNAAFKLEGSRTREPTTAPKPTPPPEPEPEDPTEDPNTDNPQDEQCSRDLVFDAATSIRGDLFFFKTGYYWRKSSAFQGIRLTKVSTKWPRINYVDAAAEVPCEDLVYLFEGNKYWGIRARAKTIIPGYPKPLSTLGLPSSVNKVDAAVFLSTTRKTLLFVGKKYWSYDEARNQMDRGYPRMIKWDFPRIGSKVDAVFENHGYLYFSSGPRQTEYYLPYRRVIRVLLNYGWLNCY